MAKFKKVLAGVLAAAMVFTLAPTASMTAEAAAAKATKGTTKITASVTKASLKVGAKKTVKLTLNKKQAKALKVTLKSSKAAVASVAKTVTVKKNAKTASFKITAKAAGKAKITASFKTSDGKTKKATVTVTVKDEQTNDDDVNVIGGKITVTDASGLQTDGTAYVGDTLQANIPFELGTMKSIIWYRDGNIIQTSSDAGDNYRTAATNTPGKYMVVGITTKDTTYKSDEITVTNVPAKATIKSVTIEDDYTRAGNVTINALDRTPIVTVTLNKNYAGTMKIYKSTDTAVGAGVDSFTTNTNVAAALTANMAGAGTSALTTTAMPSNDSMINNQTAGSAIGVINDDGTATYKFYASGAGNDANDTILRGSDYYVVFDQTGVDRTDLGGENEVKSEKITAPYVKAPASVKVTKASAGSVEAELDDENGNKLSWLTVANAQLAARFGTITYYNINSTTTAATDAPTAAAAGLPSITEGTIKIDAAAVPNNFNYVKISTVAGIYGKEAVALTSAVKDSAAAVADSIALSESTTVASTAVVQFTNLRDDGKLYIVNGEGNVAANYDSEEEILARFDANNSVALKVVDVTKGTQKVEIEGTFAGVSTTNSCENNYIAIFVPANSGSYARRMSDDTDAVTGGNQPFVLAPYLKSYKVSSTVSDVTVGAGGFTVLAYDQFNQAFAVPATAAFKLRKTNSVGTDAENAPTIAIGAAAAGTDAVVTVNDNEDYIGSGAASGAYVAGSAFTGTLSTGQTITLTCTTAGAAGAAKFKLAIS